MTASPDFDPIPVVGMFPAAMPPSKIRYDVRVDDSEDAVAATFGIIGWKGDAATVERIALDAEFGVDEAP